MVGYSKWAQKKGMDMKIDNELLKALNRCIQCCEESIDEAENFSIICGGNDYVDCTEAHVTLGEKWKVCIATCRTCIAECTRALKDAPSDYAATLNECIDACNRCIIACEKALKGCSEDAETCQVNMRESIRACNECSELCEAVSEGWA